MMKKLLRKFLNQCGAMDKILVTLLLVVVGVAAIVGLSSWEQSQRDTLKSSAETHIQSTTTEAGSGS